MKLQITHYDTAMVRLDIGPFRLLTDPVLDAPGREYRFPSYTLAKTLGSPDAARLAQQIGPVDAVLLSHAQHRDNLDDAGRALLYTMPKTLTTMPSAKRLQLYRPAASASEFVGLDNWDSHVLHAAGGEQLRITAVPAQHAPSWLFPEKIKVIGKVIGFILEWNGQQHGALYISGDTVPFGGVREIGRRFPRIGVGLFHLGAARFKALGPIKLSLSAQTALKVDDWLRPRMIVPIHYDGWKHFSETPAEVQAAFTRAGRPYKLHWLERGLATSFDI